jgi:hypothetical protein
VERAEVQPCPDRGRVLPRVRVIPGEPIAPILFMQVRVDFSDALPNLVALLVWKVLGTVKATFDETSRDLLT